MALAGLGSFLPVTSAPHRASLGLSFPIGQVAEEAGLSGIVCELRYSEFLPDGEQSVACP